MSVNCSAESIQRILRSCPNLPVDFEWHPNDDLPVESIRAIGNRIKIGCGDISSEKILEATRDCTPVERLSFRASIDPAIGACPYVEAMLLDKKACLTSLMLNLKDCGSITDVSRFLGRCT